METTDTSPSPMRLVSTSHRRLAQRWRHRRLIYLLETGRREQARREGLLEGWEPRQKGNHDH